MPVTFKLLHGQKNNISRGKKTHYLWPETIFLYSFWLKKDTHFSSTFISPKTTLIPLMSNQRSLKWCRKFLYYSSRDQTYISADWFRDKSRGEGSLPSTWLAVMEIAAVYSNMIDTAAPSQSRQEWTIWGCDLLTSLCEALLSLWVSEHTMRVLCWCESHVSAALPPWQMRCVWCVLGELFLYVPTQHTASEHVWREITIFLFQCFDQTPLSSDRCL